jgi:hypothetical protein
MLISQGQYDMQCVRLANTVMQSCPRPRPDSILARDVLLLSLIVGEERQNWRDNIILCLTLTVDNLHHHSSNDAIPGSKCT